MINLDLEAQILAAMLSNDDHLVAGLADLTKKDFAEPFYQVVFRTIDNMYRNGQTVNHVTVYEHLKDQAKGRGVTWLTLKEAYWPIGTFDHHIQMLKDLTKRRGLATYAQGLLQKIDEKTDTAGLISFAESALYSVAIETADEPIVTPQEQADRILSTVSDCMNPDKRSKTSIFTSFSKLNNHTGGLEAGDLVIISAPTGGGKSAFAMNLLRDISINQKIPGLLINTEMSRRQMDLRWAALLTDDWNITNTALRVGKITDEQYQSLPMAVNGIYQGQLYSVTIPSLTVPKMLSTIRRFKVQKSIRVVCIDYIGRADLQDAKDNRDEWQLLLSAARKLKTAAQEYCLVVLMLAQVDAQGKLAMAKYMQHESDLHLHIRPLSDEEKTACMAKMEPFWNMAVSIEKGRSAPKGVIPTRFVGEKLLFIDDADKAREHARFVESRASRDAQVNEGRRNAK